MKKLIHQDLRKGNLNKINDNFAKTGNSNPNLLNKPTDEPIFIVQSGQSNAGGFWPVVDEPMVINPRVFDYQAPGLTTEDYSFVVADPARESSHWAAQSTPLLGMKGRKHGHSGWAAADLIQKATGRDVYLFTVTWGGAGSSRWTQAPAARTDDPVLSYPTPYDLFATHIASALTAAHCTKVDLMIWCQGEFEVAIGEQLGNPSSESYALAFKNVVNTAITQGWIHHLHTHIALTDIGMQWGPTTSIHKAYLACEENCTFINTNNMPEDNLHYTGDAQQKIGKTAGQQYLLGTALSRPPNRQKEPENIIKTRGKTNDTKTFFVPFTAPGANRANTGVTEVLCVNNDKSKYAVITIHWHFIQETDLTITAQSATVSNAAGETITVAQNNGFGFTYGLRLSAPASPTGETWHWASRTSLMTINVPWNPATEDPWSVE